MFIRDAHPQNKTIVLLVIDRIFVSLFQYSNLVYLIL
jgi:hypothetical protein